MPAATPVGAKVLVSQDTTQPTIASLPDGKYMVAWTRFNPLYSTDPSTISARVFNADGSPFSAEILVTSADTSSQYMPSVTALSSGRFLLAWVDDSARTVTTGSPQWIKAQVYNADGTTSGAGFFVIDTPSGWYLDLQITPLAGDRFAAVWATDHVFHVRVFNSDGSPVSPELVINSQTTGGYSPSVASVATLDDGRFVVTWQEWDALDIRVLAQVFNADGTPAGSNFTVFDPAAQEGMGNALDVSIASLSNGGFVISWETQEVLGRSEWNPAPVIKTQNNIFAQVFDSSGGQVGSPIKVATGSVWTGLFENPGVVDLQNGRFVVTWTNSVAAFAAIYETSGNLLSNFVMEYVTTGGGYSITEGPDNSFLFAWRSSSGETIYAKKYDAAIQSWNLAGTSGDDLLDGDILNDTLSGLEGQDILKGFGGNDTLDGGPGSDVAVYSDRTSPVVVTLAESGDSSVFVNGVLRDTLRNIENIEGGFGADLITGNSLNNTLTGNRGNDVLVALGGDDIAYGDGRFSSYIELVDGNDYLYMGSGNDIANDGGGIDVLLLDAGQDVGYGGPGQDYLFGGEGNDVLYGEEGVDVLNGEAGDDTILGGDGGDYVYAGIGNDIAYGQLGNDIFVMQDGNDIAYGEEGQDYFYMGNGDDQAFGGDGVDVFLGGAGNDSFEGGSGVDYAWGEAGNDTFVVRQASGVLVIQDFKAGGLEDSVRLISDTGITSFSQALAASTYYVGMNTTIVTIDGDTAVWLVGVNKTQLTAADFLFG